MANRHLSRSIVLQTLFELDFGGTSRNEAKVVLTNNAQEFAPGLGDFPFMESLLLGILGKQKDIDLIIGKAAPEWPLEKISVVDRNVLRLGLFELLFSDRTEVPAKVAINEAIELEKSFGGDNSGRFVNGVLGAVYKELGEPGKNEISKKKKKKEVPFEEMPIEKLGGAVVYTHERGDVYLALVHDIFGHWTLSKGHLEEKVNESKEVERVIKEEIGVSITIKEKLGQNEYVATQPETGKVRKQVVYYLAEAAFEELTLKKTGGLDDAQWFKLTDVLGLNFYEDILPIVTKAIKILASGAQVKGKPKS